MKSLKQRGQRDSRCLRKLFLETRIQSPASVQQLPTPVPGALMPSSDLLRH